MIYLRYMDQLWTGVELTDTEEFKKREILIGKGTDIEDGVYIDNGVVILERVKICNGTKIGKLVSIESGTFISSKVTIGNGAKIGNRAFICTESVIGERTTIGDMTFFGSGVRIGSDTIIGNRVVINFGTSIGNRTYISGGTYIGHTARIGNRVDILKGASIGNNAKIEDMAKPITINIQGSEFPVSYWGEDRVDIGCESRSIDAWLNDSLDLAKEHLFTIEQVEEYRSYLELIKLVHLNYRENFFKKKFQEGCDDLSLD
jgi:UDP-3-O-[3-hydroxymyristoyl] glucosamine N-acyltransferase